MNSTASLAGFKADKFPAYKNSNGWAIINIFLWLTLSVLNVIKIWEKGLHPDFFNILWFVLAITYSLILIDYLMTRTAFVLNSGHLIVIKRQLFYKGTMDYEIGKMEDIEVEQVIIKTIFEKKRTKEKIITFFYDDKEVALGERLNKFDADGLYQAILAARSVS